MAIINLTPEATKPQSVEQSGDTPLPTGFTFGLGESSVKLVGSSQAARAEAQYPYSVTAFNGSTAEGALNLTVALPFQFSPSNPRFDGWVNKTEAAMAIATFTGGTMVELTSNIEVPGISFGFSNVSRTIFVTGTPTTETSPIVLLTAKSEAGGSQIVIVNVSIKPEEAALEYVPAAEPILMTQDSYGSGVAGTITGATRATSIQALSMLPSGLSWVLETPEDDGPQAVRLQGTPTVAVQDLSPTFRIVSASGKFVEAAAELTVQGRPMAYANESESGFVIVMVGNTYDRKIGTITNAVPSVVQSDPMLPAGVSWVIREEQDSTPEARKAGLYLVGTPTETLDPVQMTLVFSASNVAQLTVENAFYFYGEGPMQIEDLHATAFTLYDNAGIHVSQVYEGSGPASVTAVTPLPAGITLSFTDRAIYLNGKPTVAPALGDAVYQIKVTDTEGDSTTAPITINWTEGVMFANATAIDMDVVQDRDGTIQGPAANVIATSQTVVLEGAPAWVTLTYNDTTGVDIYFSPPPYPSIGINPGDVFEFKVVAAAGMAPSGAPGSFVNIKFTYVQNATIPAFADSSAITANAESGVVIANTVLGTVTGARDFYVEWDNTSKPGPAGVTFTRVNTTADEMHVTGKATGAAGHYVGNLVAVSRTLDITRVALDFYVLNPRPLTITMENDPTSVTAGEQFNILLATTHVA